MTKITSFDLTPFYRNSVGIDRLFDRITSQIDAAASSGNYPPYDIVRVRDDQYEIRVAAAGFRQGEIEVEFHEGRLTVHGAHTADALEEVEYLHHGISNRNWIRHFTLADYVEVKAAEMRDGVLTIRLERVVPEAMKPKKIEIAYESNNKA
jgi:molecular chaperone IbpA